jgi:PAS domain S-box-containing protein
MLARMSELPESTSRQILEGTGDAVILADRGGVIRLWNRGAERLFGFTAEEALGQTLDIIVPEKQRERHWTGYDRALETGETKYGDSLLAVPALRKDGSRVSIEFTIVLVRDDDGKILGPAAIMRDVTARWEETRNLHARIRELEGAATGTTG